MYENYQFVNFKLSQPVLQDSWMVFVQGSRKKLHSKVLSWFDTKTVDGDLQNQTGSVKIFSALQLRNEEFLNRTVIWNKDTWVSKH